MLVPLARGSRSALVSDTLETPSHPGQTCRGLTLPVPRPSLGHRPLRACGGASADPEPQGLIGDPNKTGVLPLGVLWLGNNLEFWAAAALVFGGLGSSEQPCFLRIGSRVTPSFLPTERSSGPSLDWASSRREGFMGQSQCFSFNPSATAVRGCHCVGFKVCSSVLRFV